MATHAELPSEIQEIAGVWQEYVNSIEDWQALIEGIEPIQGGCGAIYEIDNPLDRPGESFAIADMRELPFAEPHYHPAGNWELYVAFLGTATVIVGGIENRMSKGDVLAIRPGTAHYTMPDSEFVNGVVNKPPFAPENYIPLTGSNPDVQYDHEKFLARTRAA